MNHRLPHRIPTILICSLLTACASTQLRSDTPYVAARTVSIDGQSANANSSSIDVDERTISKSARPYLAASKQIIDAVLKSNDAYPKLETLCDDIGHRLSGSPQLERAIDWAVKSLKSDGHDNVRREAVSVPKWVRGEESVTLVEPYRYALPMLGLGGSVGTPPEGIRAEVVVAHDEEEFEALGERIKGRIVLFDNPMPAYDPVKGPAYGHTVRFRGKGARIASEKGAVAVLVRSVTAHSLRSPHTGMLRYGDAQKRIPAAAITTEDAAMISRLIGRGKRVVVEMKMAAREEGMVPSANVVAELPGREIPEEIVVIGGHLDSWDVGQGAHDDGAGCVVAMEALTTLRRLDLRPRRTIRVVLWTNEENGLGGARAYAEQHKDELANHVAAIESDSGAFAPRGYGLDLEDDSAEPAAAKKLEALLPLLFPLGPQHIKTGFGGADLGPMRKFGVPAMGLRVDGSRYFDYHHTHADTLDKVDPTELSQCVASMAVMAYVLAEMPDRL